MAAKTAQAEYMTGAVYGNLAYAPELTYEEAPEYELPAPREKVRTAAAPRTRIISAFSVLGFACAAVLMVMVLLSYVRLAEISVTTTQLENQLVELSKEEKALTVEYEKAFNLAAVEDYAVHKLGMVKPSDSQIKTISMKYGDKAEVLSDSGIKGGAVSRAAEFLSSLLTYFK
jgi:cell division protein FtsB